MPNVAGRDWRSPLVAFECSPFAATDAGANENAVAQQAERPCARPGAAMYTAIRGGTCTAYRNCHLFASSFLSGAMEERSIGVMRAPQSGDCDCHLNDLQHRTPRDCQIVNHSLQHGESMTR